MKYKAVIFDLDGTLIDSMGIWIKIDKEYLEIRNIPVPDNLFKDVKTGNSFTEICQYFKDKFDLPESIETIGAEWTDMVEEHYKTDIKLKPGAIELIEFLHVNTVKMGIGTSNSKYLAETVLQANNVLQYFESIVAGCEEIKGKPYPDIFLNSAEELRIDPAKCLVIEDTLQGVIAAHNGGMDAFAIFDDNDTHDVEKLKLEADFYAEDFQEILEKLTTSFR
ncbi:MAG: HAD family phosphatase [Candidatus Tenebribacter burtonii]|jgi:HAD superfamily hydrolase (TIGR01509 family)|nr:HAD family phosphatase [Candidatus Tenebribacter burtonii]